MGLHSRAHCENTNELHLRGMSFCGYPTDGNLDINYFYASFVTERFLKTYFFETEYTN